MTDTNVFQLSQPGSFADPLTEVMRKGARALLAQAVEAEVATLLSRYADETTDDGRKRLVRHGHLPAASSTLLAWRGWPWWTLPSASPASASLTRSGRP